MTHPAQADINTAVPHSGQLLEIAEGVRWARLPLPFALNHVNIYFVEDDRGWAAIDTGIHTEESKAAWERLLAGPLRGTKISRLVLTHHHPDHIGMAGWLTERFGMPVHMTETEFLLAQHISDNAGFLDPTQYRMFYHRHGMEQSYADMVVAQGHRYKFLTTGLPWAIKQMNDRDVLSIGGRDFQVLTGGGHSSQQAMLFCADSDLFLSADQVLPEISPNISVSAYDPEGDPLGQYLHSLSRLKRELPEETTVLPGHRIPFRALHQRIDKLLAHHEMRCAAIEAECRTAPRSAAEIVPVLFRRPLDPHQMSFAFTEALAHMNRLVHSRRIAWANMDGMVRAVAD